MANGTHTLQQHFLFFIWSPPNSINVCSHHEFIANDSHKLFEIYEKTRSSWRGREKKNHHQRRKRKNNYVRWAALTHAYANNCRFERWQERTKWTKKKKLLKNKTHQPEQSELNMRTIYIFKMFENRKNAPEQERARTQCGSERTRLVQMTNWLNV